MEQFFDLKDVIPPLNREESIRYFSLIFGNNNPLVVEIGSGNGHFLVQYAALNPDKNFIGTEILLGRAKKFYKKIKNRSIRNVAVFWGDTRRFVWDFLYKETVSEFVIFFPDPWPKKRHYKHRLLKMGFIQMLLFRLIPGGKVSIATDSEEYRDFIIEEFKHVDGFRPFFEKGYSDYPDDYPRSLYEDRLRKEGKRLYYMRWEKFAALRDRNNTGSKINCNS